MKRIALYFLFAATLSAQTKAKAATQVFQLQYADPEEVRSVLGMFGSVVSTRQLRTITVHTNDEETMAEVARLVQKYDVPPPPVKNVEVTIYLMSALAAPSTTPLPTEMEPVIKQLRSMFSYKGYQLIDTEVIRVRAGQGGDASAVVDNKGPTGAKTISQMKFRSATPTTDDKGRGVRIDGLKVGMKVPVTANTKGEYSYIDTGISTDVDIREGQKVVVGKVNMDGADRASIVVLTAKIAE